MTKKKTNSAIPKKNKPLVNFKLILANFEMEGKNSSGPGDNNWQKFFHKPCQTKYPTLVSH